VYLLVDVVANQKKTKWQKEKKADCTCQQ